MPRSQLGTGILSYVVARRKRSLCLQSGSVEVSNDHVRALANVAKRCEDVNIENPRADLAKANQDVINPALGVDPAVALEALAWARTRVDAATQK
jgi:F0F1-type ATP synthase epsilon subunit